MHKTQTENQKRNDPQIFFSNIDGMMAKLLLWLVIVVVVVNCDEKVTTTQVYCGGCDGDDDGGGDGDGVGDCGD